MAPTTNIRNKTTKGITREEAGVVEDFEQKPNDEVLADGEFFDGEAHAESLGIIAHDPSTTAIPNMSEEEQNMELTPQVIGPPAYGSPDPATAATRLLPITQHPLRRETAPDGTLDESGAGAAISEDYGENVLGANLAAGETTHPGGPQRSDLTDDTSGVGDLSPKTEEEYQEMKSDELSRLMQRRGISGGTKMNKDDKVKTLLDYDENPEEYRKTEDDDGENA